MSMQSLTDIKLGTAVCALRRPYQGGNTVAMLSALGTSTRQAGPITISYLKQKVLVTLSKHVAYIMAKQLSA
jgi:hypothetical protein